MKCPNCSAQIASPEGDTFACEYCGSRFHRSELDPTWKPEEQGVVREVHHHYHERSPDRLNPALGCLCFFFFPLAWILYFLYRGEYPRRAKAALIIALVMTGLVVLGMVSSAIEGTPK